VDSPGADTPIADNRVIGTGVGSHRETSRDMGTRCARLCGDLIADGRVLLDLARLTSGHAEAPPRATRNRIPRVGSRFT